jgi:RNA polymerase-binding transcription factor DksA
MALEDQAQDHEIREWEYRNVNRRTEPAALKPTDPKYGPEECEECGDEMPETRRASGYHFCTVCRGIWEDRRAGRPTSAKRLSGFASH